MSLSNKERITFNDIEDINDELIALYDEALEKGFDLGEALYTQAAFFIDYELLLNVEIQKMIKQYLFCQSFNCPPYPSLKETPRNEIDDFLTIHNEYQAVKHSIQKQDMKEKNNGRK